MTEDNFKTGLKRLTAAFRTNINEESIQIYWEYLNEISDKKWLASVEDVIKYEHRFPSIAELKKRGQPLSVAV